MTRESLMSADNTGHSPSMAAVDDDHARVIFCDAVVDWALRRAEQANAEESLRWLLVAARTASRFGGSRLAIPSLEWLLRGPARAVASVVRPTTDHRSAMAGDRRPRWLHVMSEAHTVGGHSALVPRWIRLDPSNATHSVVLTFPDRCIVPELADVAAGSGGEVTPLGGIDRLIVRANRLRALIAGADVVVFHTHQWDVVAAAACTYAEGPPVLFLNHADHEFWVGASIADALSTPVAPAWSTRNGIAARGSTCICQSPSRLRPCEPPKSGSLRVSPLGQPWTCRRTPPSR